MQKLFLILLFYSSLLLSSLIMIFSMGWLLFIGGIVLVPIIIVHLIAGARALKRIPLLNNWLYLSSFLLLAFSFLRPDMDDVNAYTGYSAMMYNIGRRSSQYYNMPWYALGLDIILLILLITVDIAIIQKGKRPPPIPVPGELV